MSWHHLACSNLLCMFDNSFLISAMGLQVLWSFGLACVDIHALRVKKDLQSPVLLSLVVIGDWVRALTFLDILMNLNQQQNVTELAKS